MKKKILIMGIETSCDETAVSIIQDNGAKPPKILANVFNRPLCAIPITNSFTPLSAAPSIKVSRAHPS